MRRALLLFLIATPLLARVDHVDITRTDFGSHFEKIVGKVYFALDPKNPHNAIIADLDKAPRNAASEADIRDRFLFDRGYTVAWIGWQFDVRPEPNRVRLYAPVAPGITGRVRSDFVVSAKVDEHPVGHIIGGAIGGTGYPVADVNDRAGVLTERDGPTAA